jgi:hypothetical protein
MRNTLHVYSSALFGGNSFKTIQSPAFGKVARDWQTLTFLRLTSSMLC